MHDIQRVMAALDAKVDTLTFNQLAKSIEQKADKFEVQNMGRGPADAEIGSNIIKLTSDFDDLDRKMETIERSIQRLVKDSDTELENLRQQLQASI